LNKSQGYPLAQKFHSQNHQPKKSILAVKFKKKKKIDFRRFLFFVAKLTVNDREDLYTPSKAYLS
jgi:hypothetical protein